MSEQTKHGFRRKLVGTVRSDKMDKTVVVDVVRRYVAKKYRRYVRSRASYKAHDENNEYRKGDKVEIQEHSPISKEKTWIVTRLVTAGVDRGN